MSGGDALAVLNDDRAEELKIEKAHLVKAVHDIEEG